MLLIVLLGLSMAGYWLGRKRALGVVGTGQSVASLHSLPNYYGYYVALWAGLPALLLALVWLFFQDAIVSAVVVAELPPSIREQAPNSLNLWINDVRNYATGNIVSGEVTQEMEAAAANYQRLRGIAVGALWVVIVSIALVGLGIAVRHISPELRARNLVERTVLGIMIAFSCVAIFSTLGIVLSVLYESILFFRQVSITEFLFSTEWSPQIALREDQVGASGSFGAVPLFTGTLLVSAIAIFIAAPIGLMSAIYLSEYASPRLRAIAKPLLEILAGIPTVVYGFFAALTMAPFIRVTGESLGLDVASESALAAGLVMGVMIIPFISSLSDDVINAVPQSLRDGSYALGATQSETIRKVVLRAALPGIVGGVLLAVSRAIGETMIVVMAAGLSARLTANPLESVTTVTVQIVTLLTGDQEFDSPKTLAAFALGLALFVTTLCLNVIALHIVRKYREQYD